MVDQEKILQFIRQRGLVLPVQLASELKQNTIITGAILSGFTKTGQVRISHTKVGGSPVYYSPENESRLQDLYKYLNEKDRRTYDLLKQKRILRDSEQTPLVRVSLRNIRDFAKPVEVSSPAGKELFWRWYLLSASEAETLANSILAPPQPIAVEPLAKKEAAPLSKPEQKPVERKAEPQKEEPVEKKPKPEKPAVQQVLEETPKQEPASDSLHEKTKKYFNGAGIIIKSAEVIKRNSEIDYVIEVPSAVGTITYYCRAKAKKRCNDSDLASAFVKGQMKKLPVLFITTGEFTKKAMDMLSTDFQNMKVKCLEVKP